MSEHVLITGGAGFIGSHLADELLRRGHRVRALDNLSPAVHGPERRRPDYLSPDVELIVGDVRDREAVTRSLQGIDAVYHLAAKVGVGESMYRIEEYTHENGCGTAVLLEVLAEKPVRRLVVASSMSVYGEGLYRTDKGGYVSGATRTRADVEQGLWDPRGQDGEALQPVPTPESKPCALESVYALSKYHQERICLITGRAYNIPTVALRFFNVYGARQALSNPYTGVLAIFASRLLHDRAPQIFEDGHQRRDFVSVRDVARASALALTSEGAPGNVFNVASGHSCSVREAAAHLGRALGKEKITPEINGQYRVGDVRHCFADITAARRVLGYEPQVKLEDGIADLAGWLAGQVARDRTAEAHAELAARGLTIKPTTAGRSAA
ncbi:MAG: NAD-dependent epimerase/dehydratase family protein [Minicystis sp.]